MYKDGTAPCKYMVVWRVGPHKFGFHIFQGPHHVSQRHPMCRWLCGTVKVLTSSHGIKRKRSSNLPPQHWETGPCLSTNLLKNGAPCWRGILILPMPNNGLVLYLVGKEDPTFVLQCTKVLTPSWMQIQHLVLTHECTHRLWRIHFKGLALD